MLTPKHNPESLDKELISDIKQLRTQIEQEIAQVENTTTKQDLNKLLVELQTVKDRAEFDKFVAKLDSMKILEKQEVSENLKSDFAKLNKSIQSWQTSLSDLSQEQLQARADQWRKIASTRVEQDIDWAKKMFPKWVSKIFDKSVS